MKKGIFVTGTDTGVGKTVVSALLIRAFMINGYTVCPMKPVETGCRRDGDVLLPSDGEFLKEIAETEEPIKNITPFCFETPVAPMVASGLEGTEVDIGLIKERYLHLLSKHDMVVVEGAGGLMVPIKEDYYMLDLVLELGLKVVVVALNRLGVLNHTLLTMEVLDKYGLECIAVFLNDPERDPLDKSQDTNLQVLRQLLDVSLLESIPKVGSLSKEELDRVSARNIKPEFFSSCGL